MIGLDNSIGVIFYYLKFVLHSFQIKLCQPTRSVVSSTFQPKCQSNKSFWWIQTQSRFVHFNYDFNFVLLSDACFRTMDYFLCSSISLNLSIQFAIFGRKSLNCGSPGSRAPNNPWCTRELGEHNSRIYDKIYMPPSCDWRLHGAKVDLWYTYIYTYTYVYNLSLRRIVKCTESHKVLYIICCVVAVRRSDIGWTYSS